MLSLQGLAAVLLLTSVTSWSASPVLDDKDLNEMSDYGVLVGGFTESSRLTCFKGELNQDIGRFTKFQRESSLATIGFCAFGRMDLQVNVGTTSGEGSISRVDGYRRHSMWFDTKPALIWGGRLGVQLYNEGCVRAVGAASYYQSSMPVKSIRGYINQRIFQLVPQFDTATPPNKLGLFVVPNEKATEFVAPTRTFTPDSFLASMHHTIYDPSASLDFTQYELGLHFGYGQTHVMFLGAKIIGGTTTLTCSEAAAKSPIGTDLTKVIDAFLGLTDKNLTKFEGSRSCYIAPVVGFCLNGKGASLELSTTLLAQHDLALRACLAF